MSTPTRAGRRLRAGVLALALALSGLTGFATPAQAAPSCGPSEAEYFVELCGPTDILQPAGSLLSREELFEAEALYASRGFGRDFLWFAPQVSVRIQDQRWAGCLDNGADRVCDDAGETFRFNEVSDNLGGTHLSVFGDEDAFIARICGNFSERRGVVYAPPLQGEKFHDRDGDGVRDAGEEGLGDWEFRVTRLRADLPGQREAGPWPVTTGADGRWSLSTKDLGPGVYRVEEVLRDGWEVTTSNAREVTVEAGRGNVPVDAGAWGNRRVTDTAKTGFRLVDPPTRIDADTPTDLTVEVELTNHGPTRQVDVRDVVEAKGPEDCTFEPARHELEATLVLGQPQTRRVVFRVLCTEPSFHPMTFLDRLSLQDASIRERAPENNTRSLEQTIEVFDASDLRLSDTALDCAPATEVGLVFRCTGRTVVTNDGPYGPTRSDASLALAGQEDCVLSPTTPTSFDQQPLAVGASRTLEATWDVTCSRRSFHPFTLTAATTPDHLHVEDRDPSDNSATAADTTEVFEDVDLEVLVDDLQCSEREASRLASSCVATVVLSNAGPADAVQTLLDLDVTPGVGCSATPATVQLARTLAAGEAQTVTQRVDLVCSTEVRHEVTVDALLRNAPTDPHAVDSDTDRLVWLPSDAKPTSFPSSVNLGKEGDLPFAVVSTARVDAVAQVDPSSLRYGVTGDEDSVKGCKAQGEDVDADGRADLVCHAETQRAGITCSTTVLQLTGRLRDGTRIVSQDDVKVLGCRKL